MAAYHLAKHHFVVVAILIIILGLGTGYALGFRFGAGFSIVRTGTLVVTELPEGASVYIDGTERGTARADGIIRAQLLPGNHTVIVSVQNDWPWNELVGIRAKETSVVRPLLIGTATSGRLLEGDEKKAARATILEHTLPSAAFPLRLSGGCASVFVSDNRIIAEATTTASCLPPEFLCIDRSCEPTIVFSPLESLQAVLPFPRRDDALLVVFGNSIYALELDPRNPRFFAPVLKGIKPVLGALPDGTPAVEDGESVFILSL